MGKRFIVVGLVLAALTAPARAAVPTTTSSVEYTCTGSATSFAVPFRFLESGHLEVKRIVTATGAEVALAAGTDYSVAGAGGTSGTVTLVAASRCGTGSTLRIKRVVPVGLQKTKFRTSGQYSAAAHEDAFDLLTMGLQQVEREKPSQAYVQQQVAAAALGVVAGGEVEVTATGTTTAMKLKDRFAAWIDPKEHGAACNQTADDTAAVQAAFNAAAAAQRGVQFSAVCRVTAPIVIPQGVSVRGFGPAYGAGLLADGTQVIRLVGSESGSGGWVFRQTIENLLLRLKPGSAPPAKFIEIVNGYNIVFHKVLTEDVPAGMTVYDITDSNHVVMSDVVVRGKADLSAQASAKGIVANGSTSLQLINPDVEALNRCIQAWGSSKVSIANIYTERCIVAVDNQMNGSGFILASGGRISVPNNSCQGFRQSVSGGVTLNLGVFVTNELGTNKTYSFAGSGGLTLDPTTLRLQFGRTSVSGQIDTPPYLLTLNPGSYQGAANGLGIGGDFATFVGEPATHEGQWDFAYLGAGAKTAHFFGNGAATLGIETDGTVTSTAPSGSNGFACAANGCRIDLGTGASDHISSDGTNLTVASALTATNGFSSGLYTIAGTNLDTCASGIEGRVRRQTGTGGTNTGSRTRVCICTSDGAASPTYAWQNVVSGTVGSASACNP